MVIRRGMAGAFAAAMAGAALAGYPAAARPELPPDVVFRPTFLTADYSHGGGTAFVMRLPESGRVFLVSTHRVFGPAGGFDHQLSGADVARVFVAVAAVSAGKSRLAILAGSPVAIHDARVADAAGSERDLSLFPLETWGFAPTLVPERGAVRRGDRVWLAVKSLETETVELRGATISELRRREIRYRLHDQEADYGGTSGAPLLAENGRLLGMHLGILRNEAGQRFGHACPVWAIEEAAEGAPPPGGTAIRQAQPGQSAPPRE